MKSLISAEFLNEYTHSLVEKQLEEEQRRVVRRRERPMTYEEIAKAAEALYPDSPMELTEVIQRFLRSKGAL